MSNLLTFTFVIFTFALFSSKANAASWPKSVEQARQKIEKTKKWCNPPRAGSEDYDKFVTRCYTIAPSVAVEKGYAANCASGFDLRDDGTTTNIKVVCDYKQIKGKATKPSRDQVIKALFEHTVYKAIRETRYVDLSNNPTGFSRTDLFTGFAFQLVDKNGQPHKVPKPNDSRLKTLPLYIDTIKQTPKRHN